MNKLKLIREKCIEANPFDLGERSECLKCKKRLCTCLDREQNSRPIRLADVLLAIEKTEHRKNIHIRSDGSIGHPLAIDPSVTFVQANWNLKETLENQSKETIDFIYNLLK